MKTDLKNIAVFLATAAWANGYYADEEKEQLKEIAEALGVDEKALTEAVDAEVAKLDEMNEDEAGEYLIEYATGIDEEDAIALMECAIEIVLADGVIERDEVETLFDLADATGSISHVEVLLMVADLIKYEPDIEVKF